MCFSRLLLLCCFATLLGACASSKPSSQYGRRGFWRPNHFDGQGRENGRWRTYYDDNKKQPFTTGRYRHGRPVRTFNYYNPLGQLDRTEVYQREGLCEVTYWHPAGQVARKGHAQWVTGKGKAPRFYWYGLWTSYNPAGQITDVQTYTDGTITRAEKYENNQLARVEVYEGNRTTRTETYQSGQLLKVETFEKGLRTGTINNL
jgi:antitoxin component YwqK of YwqJK toxin-antitoxin module